MCLLIAPFHVYADTLSQSNIKGVNFECINITPIEDSSIVINGNTYTRCVYTFHFQAVLDESYYGYVNGRFEGSYQTYDSSGTSTTASANSYARTFYVCGQTVDFYMQTQGFIWENRMYQYAITYDVKSFTLSGSNVIPFGYQDSLDEIYQTIQDMEIEQQNIVSYLYDNDNGTILEQVVTTNDLLQQAGQMFFTMMLNVQDIQDFLHKYRGYTFPIESLQAVYELYGKNYVISDLFSEYGSYIYPIFRVPAWSSVFTFYKSYNREFNIILGLNRNDQTSTILQKIVPIDDVTINVTDSTMRGTNAYRFYNIQLICNSNSNGYADLMFNVTNDVIPIFILDFNKRYNISTDFALQWGLTNEMLENIKIIANGTTQSNQSSESLDDSKDDMQESFNDMFEYESDFNNDMNTALRDLNVQFDVGNQLGSKFLASADWVRTQFNTLTNNTPIGTVISFSLILGIAMLLVGKYL